MKIYRPLKAIRLKCLDCSAGQPKEVRLCPAINCALWPYRMGKRPKLELSYVEIKNHHSLPDQAVQFDS